jgi:hypothetical protein
VKKLTIVIGFAFWLIPNIGFSFDKVLSDSLIKDVIAKGKQEVQSFKNSGEEGSLNLKLLKHYMRKDDSTLVMLFTPWFSVLSQSEDKALQYEEVTEEDFRDALDRVNFWFTISSCYEDRILSFRSVVKYYDKDSTERIVKPYDTQCEKPREVVLRASSKRAFVQTCNSFYRTSDFPSKGIIRFVVIYASGKERVFTFNLSNLH